MVRQPQNLERFLLYKLAVMGTARVYVNNDDFKRFSVGWIRDAACTPRAGSEYEGPLRFIHLAHTCARVQHQKYKVEKFFWKVKLIKNNGVHSDPSY